MPRHPSKLDLKQLEKRLSRIRELYPVFQPPRGGWIRAIRRALGMRQQDLGRQLGITKQAIADLEYRETEGAVTIAALREAARAMDAELYYVVLPVRPIQETLEERATRVARFMASQVHHSMRMEDQGTGAEEQKERFNEIRDSLLATPSLLWTLPDDL